MPSCALNNAPMNNHTFGLLALVCLLPVATLGAAESEMNSTEKLYQGYIEAYQKSAQSYDNAARESRFSSYIAYAIAGPILLFAVAVLIKARRAQTNYSESALQINRANQKRLEEIRDLLKNGRT